MQSKLPFYRQEKPYSCVPACLRMVLAAKGYAVSESVLRERCDCTFLGTDALTAVDALRAMGFSNSSKCTYAKTHGETYELALRNAKEVLEDSIYGYEQLGKSLPALALQIA